MATEIEADLRSWSRGVLEVPSEALNGLPPCPYAKQAWRDNKVLVVEAKDVVSESARLCRLFPDNDYDLVVVASYDIPPLTLFHDFIELGLNAVFSALHCMGFHPGYGAEDAGLDFLTDNDWESSVDEPYCMIFIQDLCEVVAASDKLSRMGYYTAYPDDEYEELVVARKRRLFHGNEAPSDEA